MADATQANRAGGFLISNANGTRSFDQVTVVSGQNLVAGTVIGIVTASGKVAAYDNDATNGTETAVGVIYEAVDATNGDMLGTAVVRDAEVATALLAWGAGVTADAEKLAAYDDLAAAGIICRA